MQPTKDISIWVKHYSDDGYGDCPIGKNCRYIHPGDREWATARAAPPRRDVDRSKRLRNRSPPPKSPLVSKPPPPEPIKPPPPMPATRSLPVSTLPPIKPPPIKPPPLNLSVAPPPTPLSYDAPSKPPLEPPKTPAPLPTPNPADSTWSIEQTRKQWVERIKRVLFSGLGAIVYSYCVIDFCLKWSACVSNI